MQIENAVFKSSNRWNHKKYRFAKLIHTISMTSLQFYFKSWHYWQFSGCMAFIRQAQLHETNRIIKFLTFLFDEQKQTSWMLAFLINNIVVLCVLIYATIEFFGSTISLISHETVGDDLYLELKFDWRKGMYSLYSPLIAGLLSRFLRSPNKRITKICSILSQCSNGIS